ncbi:MAG: hypothetical protein WEA56_14865 [Balneolaceae bacterium]
MSTQRRGDAGKLFWVITGIDTSTQNPQIVDESLWALLRYLSQSLRLCASACHLFLADMRRRRDIIQGYNRFDIPTRHSGPVGVRL